MHLPQPPVFKTGVPHGYPGFEFSLSASGHLGTTDGTVFRAFFGAAPVGETGAWRGRVMESAVLENAESAILARIIAAGGPVLSAAVAGEILNWSFNQDDRDRMSMLADKARTGGLTPPEAEELDAYERVSSFLGLVKSKARRSLQQSSVE